MAGEIIRQGGPTSHGGIVLEGSPLDICHGKPISFIGHHVQCPKCKGSFPIVEGAPVTTFYGKGVALAGMKTACGAILIATQFLDTVEYGGGNQSRKSAEQCARSDSSHTTSPRENRSDPSGAAASDIQEEHTYELMDSNGHPVEGYLYDLHCDDSLHTKKGRYVDGATVSVLPKRDSRMVCWLERDGGSR